MANPRLVPFRAEHLQRFIGRDGDFIESTRNSYDKEARGPAFTAICNEYILGCAGVIIPWPGIGVAWAVFSQELLDKYPIWTTRIIRTMLYDVIAACNLRRVEMTVLEKNMKSQQWARMLGFTRENGCARRFTVHDENVVRYELVEL